MRYKQLFSLILVKIVISGILNTLIAQNSVNPKYKVIEELDVQITMSDGVRLSTNIYRPDNEGKFPTILIRTPYGKGASGNKDGHFFAEHGFVYITQDTRGRNKSEGQFYAMINEGKDGFETQEWIGKQIWSDGNIGTAGGSYVGYTQWIASQYKSKYLKTMIPAVTFSNLYNTIYQNGAFFLGLFVPWSIGMTKPFILEEFKNLQKNTDSLLLSLPLLDIDKKAGWRISFLRDWFMHFEKDKYWSNTEVIDQYHNIDYPIYHIGGWYDIFLGETIENYLNIIDASTPKIRLKQKLLLGPWTHDWGKQFVGELDFGDEATVNIHDIQLPWFENHLKEIENDIMAEPPIKIFVMGVNKWRFENEWPLARTKYRNYYFNSDGNANTLNGDGSLSWYHSEIDSHDTFIYNPNDPVISNEQFGPYNQVYTENRDDVLVYTSPTLEKEIEVTGPVKVVLYASSTAKNTDFTAKLVDVYPDGRAIRICEGIIRASHRNPDESPTNIVPGRIYEYQIDLWATSNLFKKNHKIRVEISSSCFPRFDRNLNTGNNFATDTSVVNAKQIIYHSNIYPSSIVLPIIE